MVYISHYVCLYWPSHSSIAVEPHVTHLFDWMDLDKEWMEPHHLFIRQAALRVHMVLRFQF